ncbi:MAG: lipoyl domain-containing protein [Actinomycetota bacterium]
MSTQVTFPVMSKDPDIEGVVGTWFALDGETVEAGQVIAEVQVDKVSNDVPAPASGTLRHVVPEGGGVAQGAVLAVIE